MDGFTDKARAYGSALKAQRISVLRKTMRHLEQVVAIRDGIAENGNADGTCPGLISHPELNMRKEKIFVGALAKSSRRPLQLALFQSLREVGQNTWKLTGAGENVVGAMAMAESLMLDAVRQTAPEKHNTVKTYDDWWEDACRKLSPTDTAKVLDALVHLDAFMLLHLDPHDARLIRGATSELRGQIVQNRCPHAVLVAGRMVAKAIDVPLKVVSWCTSPLASLRSALSATTSQGIDGFVDI